MSHKTITYRLTNVAFEGSRITDYPNGVWRRDKISFFYKTVTCILQQANKYKEILEELGETHGSAVTAVLTLSGEEHLGIESADELADAVCELLAFATKNTVFWIAREIDPPSGEEPILYKRSLGGRARNFHTGWSIISDVVVTTTEHRPELELFLDAVL